MKKRWLWIVGGLTGAAVALWLVFPFLFYMIMQVRLNNASDLPAPSKEIREALAGQNFYFTNAGSIYELKWPAYKARRIKTSECGDRKTPEGKVIRINYFLPTKSPDQRRLAFYRIFRYDPSCNSMSS